MGTVVSNTIAKPNDNGFSGNPNRKVVQIPFFLGPHADMGSSYHLWTTGGSNSSSGLNSSHWDCYCSLQHLDLSLCILSSTGWHKLRKFLDGSWGGFATTDPVDDDPRWHISDFKKNGEQLQVMDLHILHICLCWSFFGGSIDGSAWAAKSITWKLLQGCQLMKLQTWEPYPKLR